jgi:hypothetical protein
MSALKLNIPHHLSKAEALQRIKQLLGNLKEEQKDNITNLKENWTEDKGNFSFSMKGFDLEGTIEVTDTNVALHSELPFAVSFFKGTIAGMITEKAKKLLA